MPTAASAALRAAVHAALTADAAIIAALGGPKVYDEPPREAAFPYVTLGETRVADFSAGSEPTLEHQLTLHAWSRQGGHREAHVIAGALLQALDDAPLALAGHRLVNFRFATADVRREADGRTYHALVRFRAVTEPNKPGSGQCASIADSHMMRETDGNTHASTHRKNTSQGQDHRRGLPLRAGPLP